LNRNDDSGSFDDELHASLHALLHDGDFGKDEPADEETVRREISMILGRADSLPATVQEPSVKAPPPGNQNLRPRRPSRHPVAPPTRTGHLRPPRRSERGAVPALSSLEEPTSGAELKINTRRLVSAEGTVPADQAHHLITTFGILGSVVSGTVGAVLTLLIVPALTTIAFAELTLGLIAAIFIAATGRHRAKARAAPSETPPVDAQDDQGSCRA
jgi:hypothetical protein